jgi:damage-control phosphatase, subfamily I
MLIQLDCIPCLLKMSLSVMRKLPLDVEVVEEIYAHILGLPAMRGLAWDVSSPEVIETIMEKINGAVGDPDPFFFEKRQQNKKIMALYPVFEQVVAESSDPLYTAVKLAIIGNAIDFMMCDDMDNMEELIMGKLESPFPSRAYAGFVEQVKNSKQILYIGDNSGEIGLDRLLIETMKAQYGPEILFVVRSVPSLNDVTRKEATFVGMDEVATVVENGTAGPVPGTILGRCSGKIRDLFQETDLIISKGGGNFDSLEGKIKGLQQNITFMLLSKCYPYSHYFGVPEKQPILANFFQKKRT